jgi:signal-transduction protein with cAMP-binding, CBS, and nucleotidyltransferase domain
MTTVRDLLERKGGQVLTIGPDQTVLEAARHMNDARVGALVVVGPTLEMIGIVTERDILTRVVADRRPPEGTPVSSVMTTRIIYCEPATPVAECREMMTQRRLRHLPVLDDNRLIGLISIGDIMAHEAAQQQITIEYMHQYIHGRA